MIGMPKIAKIEIQLQRKNPTTMIVIWPEGQGRINVTLDDGGGLSYIVPRRVIGAAVAEILREFEEPPLRR